MVLQSDPVDIIFLSLVCVCMHTHAHMGMYKNGYICVSMCVHSLALSREIQHSLKLWKKPMVDRNGLGRRWGRGGPWPSMELVSIEWILALPQLYGIQVTTSAQDDGKAVINNSDSSWCQSLAIVQGCALPSLGTGYSLPFSVKTGMSLHASRGSCEEGMVGGYDLGL